MQRARVCILPWTGDGTGVLEVRQPSYPVEDAKDKSSEEDEAPCISVTGPSLFQPIRKLFM